MAERRFFSGISPPGMPAALTKERATVLLQMTQQLATLHTITASST